MVYASKKPVKAPVKAVESGCETAWRRYRNVEPFLLLRSKAIVQPQIQADEEDALMMSLFLNFAVKDLKDSFDNPSSLEFYTEEMAAEDDELLAGVLLDD